jgi:hypothetical protein
LTWWKSKNTLFCKVVFVTTTFGHCIVLSPKFQTKVQDMKCNKTRKTIWKEKLCMHERINKFTFCNIFEHPIFFWFHGCLSCRLLFLSSPLFYLTFVFKYSFKFFLWTLWSPLAFGDRCVFQFKLNDGLILLYTPHGNTWYNTYFHVVFLSWLICE